MTKDQKVLIFENSHVLTNYLLKKWIQIAQESVQRANRFTVALSGGRSPLEFYCRLSNFKDFTLWQRTHIFMGDERFVPADDQHSNFKMIKDNLLNYVNIPPENVHAVPTFVKNVDLAAEQYKNELVRFFDFEGGNMPIFDFMFLGVGLDGHTASLFPDDKNIFQEDRLVLPVSLPHLKQERVSLTLSVINNARNVIVLILGANKAHVAKQIIEDKADIPAAKVDPKDGQIIYLLDKEAASKLSYKDSYTHEGEAVLYNL